MKQVLRVSLAQINTTVGDFDSNRQKVIQAIRQAQSKNAQVITFPELALTGYPPEDLLFKTRFISKNIESLHSILPFTKDLMVVLGFVDRDKKGALYNAAAVILNKKIQAIYHKNQLPNYGVFDEKRYFTAGMRPVIVEFQGISLGITICEDIWQKDSFVYQSKFFRKAAVLINISASPYHRGKQSQREALVKSLARKIKSPVIYHNLVGGQDELVFDGGSMLVDSAGKMIAQAKRFEEEILTGDLLVESNRKTAAGQSPWLDFSKRSMLLSEEEEVYKALVLGAKDYIQKNRFRKVLIGLSGGIDSALVACIAVDALGRQNVIGVTMPSRFTSKETYEDAKKLAKNLEIKCLEFNIWPIYQMYLMTFRRAFSGCSKDKTEENLQARIRGNILMALSNKFGHLVFTTGNKSEMATGYCTLYGDMAGGFAVIKDVPKTMVFRLARYRNSMFPKNTIPPSTLKRPPTAELRFNQKDQDTLPPYSALDKALELYVEKDLTVEDVIKKGVPKSWAQKIARMVDGNEYKRRQSPPGIKITPKAFGRDRRIPITNRFLA